MAAIKAPEKPSDKMNTDEQVRTRDRYKLNYMRLLCCGIVYELGSSTGHFSAKLLDSCWAEACIVAVPVALMLFISSERKNP